MANSTRFTLSSSRLVTFLLLAGYACAAGNPEIPATGTAMPLFNGKDLSGFDTFLRDKGLNKDPDHMFRIENGMLHISGAELGYVITKKEYGNYYLRCEFKWGEETWPPRLGKARDSGILFHVTGKDVVWPRSIEFQMIEGGTGDIIMTSGVALTVKDVTKSNGRFDRFGKGPWTDVAGYRDPSRELENPHGQWNTLELLADGDRIKYWVNGRLANEGSHAEVTRGRVLFQSEGAEVFFRNIEISPLKPRNPNPASVHALESRLELFVDRTLIDRMSGVELRLNHPIDAGSVLKFDQPWDGRYSAYFTVLKDGLKYLLYYRGKPNATPDGADDESTCYAESPDGIRWTKPDLGLYGHNNVILDKSVAPVPHNFSPFLDTRPGVPPAERYKALGGLFDMQGHASSGGLIAFVSADGIHWKKLRDAAVITRENYSVQYTDTTMTPSFWSESEQRYVAYLRTWKDDGTNQRQGWGGNVRWVGRTTSSDFIHWSKVEMMDFGDAPVEQLYSNTTSPYFRAPQIYIGLTPRIVFNRPVISREQAAAIGIDPGYAHDSSEPVLLTTRGGSHYDRTFLEAFIRNGIGPENWTSRNNYPALNVVPTGPAEISLYVEHDYGQPSCHLERYTLVTDRFASVNAPFKGGEFTTLPITFQGSRVWLNFSSSVAGGIRVEIEDADGNPLPGFTLDDAIEAVGNEIERSAAWKAGSDVSKLAGTPVRLRFVMKEADLYALRFR
jgi:hypothetical protein